jgi:ribonucrease Y
MSIVLDVLVAGVVAGGVAGGVVLASRPRGGAGAASHGGGTEAAGDAHGDRTAHRASDNGRHATADASQASGVRAPVAAGSRAGQADGSASGDRVGAAAALRAAEAGGSGATAVRERGAGAPGDGRAPSSSGGGAGGGHDGASPAPPAAALSTGAGAASARATDTASAPGAAHVPTAAGRAAVRAEIDDELRERRAEIARIEERLLTKQESLDVRLEEAARRERSLADRSRNLELEAEKLKAAKREHIRELERIASLSSGQARQILLRELEDELRHDSAKLVRQVEEETRREADRRARSILATAMQRLAGGHAVETTVSTVPLQSDDLKGRVIGREGRNIRALEMLTGIDFIVDDTPGAVILSGFDGVRREIAKVTLEKLLQDGRIHPARIEEAYYAARSEIENRIMEVGEQAVLEANVGTLHPELTKLLGRLHYRTSYGQNVLAHSIECANLAGMLAAELGASTRTAARAALLHDIGKAVTHEVEGPHAIVGGELARRHNESEAVAHAMEAHHNEVPVRTIEAVIVQIVDSLSGARPGARGESLENYTKRLRELEEIAKRHTGVEKVYAMQAGREIRVIVQPEEVDDDTAALLSHRIARDVEKELEYAGQIKVTVIRESRSVDFAK